MVAKKSSRSSRYSVTYSCSNCEWSGNESFDRGVPAPATIECPRCGCKTASRGWKLPPSWPPILPWKPRPRPVVPINPWLPKRPPFDPWRPVKPWKPWRPYPMDPCDPPWPWDRPIYEDPRPYIPTRTTDNTEPYDDFLEGPRRNRGTLKQDSQRSSTRCVLCLMPDDLHATFCPRGP